MSNDELLIHVRFAPNGSVTNIGERPDTTPSQSWFDQLSARFGEAYQPLSGGRGVFRIKRGDLDGIRAAAAGT